MRKLILLGALAAVALPAVADAQSHRELRHDRRDIRHEERQLNQARASGDRRDIRDERHDVREARQEYREDFNDRNHRWNNDDWYRYREQDRRLYARGDWRAPFRYVAFRPGVRIRNYYYEPRYYITDPWRYRLPPIYSYQRWVRHYNDVLLVDIRSGIVLRVIHGFYW